MTSDAVDEQTICDNSGDCNMLLSSSSCWITDGDANRRLPVSPAWWRRCWTVVTRQSNVRVEIDSQETDKATMPTKSTVFNAEESSTILKVQKWCRCISANTRFRKTEMEMEMAQNNDKITRIIHLKYANIDRIFWTPRYAQTWKFGSESCTHMKVHECFQIRICPSSLSYFRSISSYHHVFHRWPPLIIVTMTDMTRRSRCHYDLRPRYQLGDDTLGLYLYEFTKSGNHCLDWWGLMYRSIFVP